MATKSSAIILTVNQVLTVVILLLLLCSTTMRLLLFGAGDIVIIASIVPTKHWYNKQNGDGGGGQVMKSVYARTLCNISSIESQKVTSELWLSTLSTEPLAWHVLCLSSRVCIILDLVTGLSNHHHNMRCCFRDIVCHGNSCCFTYWADETGATFGYTSLQCGGKRSTRQSF